MFTQKWRIKHKNKLQTRNLNYTKAWLSLNKRLVNMFSFKTLEAHAKGWESGIEVLHCLHHVCYVGVHRFLLLPYFLCHPLKSGSCFASVDILESLVFQKLFVDRQPSVVHLLTLAFFLVPLLLLLLILLKHHSLLVPHPIQPFLSTNYSTN